MRCAKTSTSVPRNVVVFSESNNATKWKLAEAENCSFSTSLLRAEREKEGRIRNRLKDIAAKMSPLRSAVEMGLWGALVLKGEGEAEGVVASERNDYAFSRAISLGRLAKPFRRS